jgi:hypothetical protein
MSVVTGFRNKILALLPTEMASNKKAEDFSPASFWLVPSPRHLAKNKILRLPRRKTSSS